MDQQFSVPESKRHQLGLILKKNIFELNYKLNEFVNSNSPETKQKFGDYIVNTHKKIKLLIKFVQSIKKAKTLEELHTIVDPLKAAKLNEIKKLGYEINLVNRSFNDMAMDFSQKMFELKFFKLPNYDISKAVSILTLTRGEFLDGDILRFVVENCIDYYSIRKHQIKEIFEFKQRFEHNISEVDLEKFKAGMRLFLKKQIIMNRLENVIHNEKLVETDLGFRYEIGTMISYEVRYVLFHDKMTYIFKMNEIKEGKNSFFHLSVEEKKILIAAVNQEFFNLEFELSQNQDEDKMMIDNNDLNSQIESLSKILRKFTNQLVFPLLIKKIQEKIEKIIQKELKNVCKSEVEGNVLKIIFSFEFNCGDEFFISFDSVDIDDRTCLRITYSHWQELKQSPVCIRNVKQIYELFEIQKLSLPSIIIETFNYFKIICTQSLFKKLQISVCDQLPTVYYFKENSISCYINKHTIAFRLSYNDCGSIVILDEMVLNLKKSEKLKIKAFLKLVGDNNLTDIEYNQVTQFYVFLYNTCIKRQFNRLTETTLELVKHNEIAITVPIAEQLFPNSGNKRKFSLLYRIFLDDFSRIRSIQSFTNLSEELKEYKQFKLSFEMKNFDTEVLKNIYLVSQNFKSSYIHNIYFIYEAMNYGKIRISDDFSVVEINRLNSLPEDMSLFHEYFDRLLINLKRALVFKICLKQKYKDCFDEAFLRNFYHQDTEFQIDYNASANEINIGIITKLKARSLENEIRRFFQSILPKFVMIMLRTARIAQHPEFRSFVSTYATGSVISPLSFDLKRIHQDVNKYLSIHIQLEIRQDKKLMKVNNGLTRSISSPIYQENFRNMFEDLNEKFVENLKNVWFYNRLIEKMYTNYSHTIFNKRLYENIISSGQTDLILLPKTNLFHLIMRNKISLILETIEANKVKIYYQNFPGYDRNSRFMELLISYNANNNGSHNQNGNNQSIGVRKAVLYQFDPKNLDNEILHLMDVLDNLSMSFR